MRLIFGRVECISEAAHALIESERDYLLQSEKCVRSEEKLRPTVECYLKDENGK